MAAHAACLAACGYAIRDCSMSIKSHIGKRGDGYDQTKRFRYFFDGSDAGIPLFVVVGDSRPSSVYGFEQREPGK